MLDLKKNYDLCFYHAGCFDGWCAAWIVKKFLPHCELFAIHHSDPLPDGDFIVGKDIVVVDFCFAPESLDLLANKSASIVILDHHKKSFDQWKDFSGDIFGRHTVFLDDSKSGAVLSWEHFVPDPLPAPEIVRYVQDRDLWKWELPRSREVNAYIQSTERSEKVWDALVSGFDLGRYVDLGSVILRKDQHLIDTSVSQAVKMVIAGHTVPVLNTTVLHSEIGEVLCQGYPFSATYFDRLRDNLRVWSLRSAPDGLDVNEIAKKFGGGGHKHAAGFQVQITRDEIVPTFKHVESK
jgi:hypothetical protein